MKLRGRPVLICSTRVMTHNRERKWTFCVFQLNFKEFDTFDGGNGDGTASDIEVEINANGKLIGFVTSGLDFNQIYQDGTDGCPAGGCAAIKGRFTKYNADLSQKVWEQRFNNFPGGKYQYAGLTAASEPLIYTECFGITRVHDSMGTHIGYTASCGQGIENCEESLSTVIWFN